MTYNFDDVFKEVGQCGRYQIYVYILLGLVSFLPGWQFMVIFFIAGNQEHWCHIPELANLSYETQKEIGVPKIKDSYSYCERYDFKNVTLEDVQNETGWFHNNSQILPCDHGWVYDTSWWPSTIVSQFNLVCDKKWLIALSSTLFMTGVLIGCPTFGALADRIGRRKVLVITLGLQGVFGIAAALSPFFPLFTVLRFLCGATSAGSYTAAFVLIVELVGPKYRTPLILWVQGFFGAGFMTIPGIAYLVRDHVILQIVVAIPAILLTSYHWLVPESPRWLLSERRYTEAEKILQKMAHYNKQPASDKLHFPREDPADDSSEDRTHEYHASFLDLLRTPNMRKKYINLFFNWMVNSLVYYGLSFSSGSFGSDIYLNIFLGGLVELPAYLVAMFVLDRFGRRYILLGFMVIGGAACLGTIPLLGQKQSALLLTIAMVGKFCISASFAIVYLYTAELSPTVVRTIGVGAGSMHARIGGLLAPQLAALVTVWLPLPSLLFGVLAITAGLLVLLLPETRHRELPETLEDGEKYGMFSTNRSPNDSEDLMLKESTSSGCEEDIEQSVA